MATSDAAADFLAGVIEGFYGQPWSPAERFELFGWMADLGLNTYLYAPKDDLKQRVLWREPYSTVEEDALRKVIQACARQSVRFIYALSPGLDIHYGHEAETDRLRHRFAQMTALGCQSFALLFDDIPERLDDRELKRFNSLAAAQCHVANAVFRWAREQAFDARFCFCPTPYCGRMAARSYGGAGYLETVGRELLPEIDVFWTGPDIISQTIPLEHLRELRTLLRRKPLLWDNLHANDYDGRRFYCGPYAGRARELRGEVAGILSNPNNELPLNFVPLRTLAEFVRGAGVWDARAAYLDAMREWWSRFATVGQPLEREDFILFGDCHYLPNEEGAEAASLLEQIRLALGTQGAPRDPSFAELRQRVRRLRDFCARLAELRDRSLFYALSRRIWDLREELDVVDRFLEWKASGDAANPACHSDFHLPGTWRGGIIAHLQRLLVQRPDGAFVSES